MVYGQVYRPDLAPRCGRTIVEVATRHLRSAATGVVAPVVYPDLISTNCL